MTAGRGLPLRAGVPVSAALAEHVSSGALRADPAQAHAAEVLDRVARELASGSDSALWWERMFAPHRPRIRGAYLVGDVGRGKTMLMDLFFGAVATGRKRRVHFHEFMDEVHAGIAAFRAQQRGRHEDADPVAAVTRPLCRDLRLLCLDEFQVQDITNAMLLGRLFEGLFQGGVVLVATSNTPPRELYRNGLNRQLFLPFIDLLEQETETVPLAGETDYRRLKFGGEQMFHFGPSPTVKPQMDALWARLTGGVPGAPARLQSLGRTIPVPLAAMGAARFSAAELLDAPLGARDFVRLAHAFDAIMIDGVPRFDRTRSDAAKRFILLVDSLYDGGVKLAASFGVPLGELPGDERTRGEFGRTLSRLAEMGSEDYLAAPRRRAPETKG